MKLELVIDDCDGQGYWIAYLIQKFDGGGYRTFKRVGSEVSPEDAVRMLKIQLRRDISQAIIGLDCLNKESPEGSNDQIRFNK